MLPVLYVRRALRLVTDTSDEEIAMASDPSAHASGYATAGEAKSMLERAVAELKASPKDALSKFNDPNGAFRDRDLYVFCFDMSSGKMTAAYDRTLLGVDIRTLQDADGSPLGVHIFNAATEGVIATVAFNWPRPGSHEPVPKEAFITCVGDQGCGVGYYKATTSVADYLASRLAELGVDHLFNVPGSYCEGLMRALATSGRPRPVFTTYELEAVYAADAYARLKGFGAFCGTYGVGGLSSLNGVAGAYVERCPVIAINGGPSRKQLQDEIKYGILFLHSTGRLRCDATVYGQVTAAVEIVNVAANAPAQIDSVLTTCMSTRRPVYLEISQDLWDQPCLPPQKPLSAVAATTDPEALSECLDDVVARVRQSKSTILWGGEEIARWGLQYEFRALLSASGLSYVTTLPGKSLLPETTPGFIGVYDGRFTHGKTQAIVSGADLVIALGTAITDFIGQIVAQDYGRMVLAAGGGVRVGHHTYGNISLTDFISGLAKRLADLGAGNYATAIRSSGVSEPAATHPKDQVPDVGKGGGDAANALAKSASSDAAITFDAFFAQMQSFVEGKIVIADTSLSLFASAEMTITAQSSYVSQAIWMSIGYSLGASVGAALASSKRPVVFVGDAGFREGPQVLSTLAQYDLPAVVCLISNSLLGIQQFLTGPKFFEDQAAPPDFFNVLSNWDYAALAKAFRVRFARVTALNELRQALQEADRFNLAPYFIEVVLDPRDLPSSVRDALPRMAASEIRKDFEYPLLARAN